MCHYVISIQHTVATVAAASQVHVLPAVRYSVFSVSGAGSPRCQVQLVIQFDIGAKSSLSCMSRAASPCVRSRLSSVSHPACPLHQSSQVQHVPCTKYSPSSVAGSASPLCCMPLLPVYPLYQVQPLLRVRFGMFFVSGLAYPLCQLSAVVYCCPLGHCLLLYTHACANNSGGSNISGDSYMHHHVSNVSNNKIGCSC